MFIKSDFLSPLLFCERFFLYSGSPTQKSGLFSRDKRSNDLKVWLAKGV